MALELVLFGFIFGLDGLSSRVFLVLILTSATPCMMELFCWLWWVLDGISVMFLLDSWLTRDGVWISWLFLVVKTLMWSRKSGIWMDFVIPAKMLLIVPKAAPEVSVPIAFEF